MTETPDRTESVFAAAVALATAEERAALLDRECAGDAGLRGHVEALLRAHERAGHMLDRPVPGGPDQTGAFSPREQPGAIIAGRYKLLEKIGEGGMDEVWVAEQTQPVRRKVALKLIKAGMDSKAVLARFEAERQALAVMDHPNIAKVLDGGITGEVGSRQLAVKKDDRVHCLLPSANCLLAEGLSSSWSTSRACRSPSIATPPG